MTDDEIIHRSKTNDLSCETRTFRRSWNKIVVRSEKNHRKINPRKLTSTFVT